MLLKHLQGNHYSKLPGITNQAAELKGAMTAFLNRDIEYRTRFAQENFEIGFDGYSYPGQIDSINQAYDDYLHSMVLSEFYPIAKYPSEFHFYLKNIFPKMIKEVKESIEWEELETELGLEGKLGFSFSVNYYPSFESSGEPSGVRLTEHIDGSLLTIFPYGFDEGLQINDQGNWINWIPLNGTVCFPGYMMDLATNGEIGSLNHRLNWTHDQQRDRFAFALFIVPKPNVVLNFANGEQWNTKEYYQNYLALFD
tara:strand:- start:12865 stop:13626 length:762 start_codon:yes stop_codon:yes gene_type:complete